MTTRRHFLTLIGAGAASALAGCDPRAGSSPAGRALTPPDVLVLDTTAGLTVLRGGAAESYGAAVLTPDRSRIYAVGPAGADTDLRAITTASGQATAPVRLRGAWVPSVAAGDGTVALTPAPGPGPGTYPAGSARTAMLIAGTGEPRRIDLAGNYVPDAFTADSTALFVLDWLPAAAPDHYRVREIDLATATPTALWTRDKQLIPPEDEEDMRGERRTAVFGSGDQVLYTLYTNQPRAGAVAAGTDGWDAAFVHTLQLVQHWAYCVDLPAPFGLGPNAGHASAIQSDGRRLFVLDAGSGRLAVIDTDALAVTQNVDLPADRGSAYAATGPESLFVAVGPRVRVVDAASLTVRATWDLPGPALGVVASTDGSRVYIGLEGALAWYDARTGRLLGTYAVPGLTGLRAAP